MKKYKLILLIVIIFIALGISFLFVGYVKKEKVRQEEERIKQEEMAKQEEITKLRGQASIYLDDGDFENVIELYDKILDIEENNSIRQELTEIKYEKKSVEVTKEFLKVIKDVNINYAKPSSLTELKERFLKIQEVVNEIEKIDTDKETDIAKYLEEVKGLDDYRYLKELITMEAVMEAEKTESLAAAQSSLNMGSSLSISSAFIVGQAGKNLKQHTDYILEIIPPEKYRNIL